MFLFCVLLLLDVFFSRTDSVVGMLSRCFSLGKKKENVEVILFSRILPTSDCVVLESYRVTRTSRYRELLLRQRRGDRFPFEVWIVVIKEGSGCWCRGVEEWREE